MTDGTTTTATPPHETERRLVRPHDDRVIAGVAAGLARYFDMSPLVYRIAFFALLFLGGAGIVLYVAAWLVIPDERRGESVVGEALRDRRDRPWLVAGVGLIAVALLLGIGHMELWPFSDSDGLWFVALVVGIVLVAWQLSERRPGGASAVAQGSTPAPPPADADADGDWETTQIAAPVPAPPPRRRFPVFLPTLGIVIAGAGVLGILEAADVVDVDWTLALAGGVVIVGLAVAVGAFFGAAGALAAFGVMLVALMALAVSLDIPLRGPIGERTERPATASELERDYEQSIGDLTVDLRDVDLPSGTTRVDASVGIGELVVYVPRDARVVVDADVKGGNLNVFGHEEDGWEVSERQTLGTFGGDDSTLVLDAEVGYGNLEVHRG